MPKTIKLIPPKPDFTIKKRVCAYARVSSGKDAMLHSLSAQVSYYSDIIQNIPDAEFVGVYSDEACTGTKKDRPGFSQMLSDCRVGRIDRYGERISKCISKMSVLIIPRTNCFSLNCNPYIMFVNYL